jgi:hypothetical protein
MVSGPPYTLNRHIIFDDEDEPGNWDHHEWEEGEIAEWVQADQYMEMNPDAYDEPDNLPIVHRVDNDPTDVLTQIMDDVNMSELFPFYTSEPSISFTDFSRSVTPSPEDTRDDISDFTPDPLM